MFHKKVISKYKIVAKNYDPKQLKMGIAVEHEHTGTINKILDMVEFKGDRRPIFQFGYKGISEDHLNELPYSYYTLLKDMEKKGKEEVKKEEPKEKPEEEVTSSTDKNFKVSFDSINENGHLVGYLTINLGDQTSLIKGENFNSMKEEDYANLDNEIESKFKDLFRYEEKSLRQSIEDALYEKGLTGFNMVLELEERPMIYSESKEAYESQLKNVNLKIKIVINLDLAHMFIESVTKGYEKVKNKWQIS